MHHIWKQWISPSTFSVILNLCHSELITAREKFPVPKISFFSNLWDGVNVRFRSVWEFVFRSWMKLCQKNKTIVLDSYKKKEHLCFSIKNYLKTDFSQFEALPLRLTLLTMWSWPWSQAVFCKTSYVQWQV